VITKVFGHNPAKAQHYPGGVAAHEFLARFKDIAAAIELIETDLQLPFSSDFAGHMGGFDRFELEAPLDGPALISCAPSSAGAPTLLLRRRQEDSELTVRVCMESGSEVYAQDLRPWPAGSGPLAVNVPSNVDHVVLEVYERASGALVFRAAPRTIGAIRFGMAIAGRTLTHADTLAKRAQSLPKEERASSESTTAHDWQRMVIHAAGANRGGPDVRHAIERIMKPSGDLWFDRGVGGELDVIEAINVLLETGDVCRAIIADPFFGEEALRRFVLRVRNASLDLSVITSWGRSHPDTAQNLVDGLALNTTRLDQLIRAVAGAVPCRLRVRNIVGGTDDQAFHDRYLAIYQADGNCRIWLLSNSINAMAMYWPFCMSEVHGEAWWRAKQYLEHLDLGQDITSERAISTTYQWPTPSGAAPSAA
jgi:hypothetical protein